jgi:hypothetical protein
MNAAFLPEPELQFATGKHVDVRFGIKNYAPFDRATRSTPRTIRLGVVGTPETVEGVTRWLEQCQRGFDSKPSKQPNLFPAFPGFGSESPFHAQFEVEQRCQRCIKLSEFTRLASLGDLDRVLEESIGLFIAELRFLADETNAEVMICSLPNQLLQLLDAEEEPETDESEEQGAARLAHPKRNFRHLLKARAMSLRRPIQIVLPTTYGGRGRKRKRRGLLSQVRRVQDDATRAWNFHVALYYKGGGIPWRLIRDSGALTTCYVGIAFYRSVDQQRVHTSLAQVFDERGDGVIVRGANATLGKDDRIPHLSEDDAHQAVQNALSLYRREHKTLPARVVLHKSSGYTPAELSGFLSALRALNIDQADFLSLRRSFTRLFRAGAYPPLRGTFLRLDERIQVLYTKGSVDFFETYPGMYVPLPLEIDIERAEQTPTFLAREILALTKMNWNTTQFDNALPITLHAADQVGDILKHLTEDDEIHPRYSFYM